MAYSGILARTRDLHGLRTQQADQMLDQGADKGGNGWLKGIILNGKLWQITASKTQTSAPAGSVASCYKVITVPPVVRLSRISSILVTRPTANWSFSL